MDQPLDERTPRYGERAVAWEEIWELLYREEWADNRSHREAAEMERIRGLVMHQGTQVETLLSMVLRNLSPGVETSMCTAGQLARLVKKAASPQLREAWGDKFSLIEFAIDRRNNAVHSEIIVGMSEPHPGVFVPTISLMGDDLYDECDLLRDLAIEQSATEALVTMLHELTMQELTWPET